MADKTSLGFLGIAFGSVTVAVMLIAAVVVKSHVDGRLSLDNTTRTVVTASLPTSIR